MHALTTIKSSCLTFHKGRRSVFWSSAQTIRAESIRLLRKLFLLFWCHWRVLTLLYKMLLSCFIMSSSLMLTLLLLRTSWHIWFIEQTACTRSSRNAIMRVFLWFSRYFSQIDWNCWLLTSIMHISLQGCLSEFIYGHWA